MGIGGVKERSSAAHWPLSALRAFSLFHFFSVCLAFRIFIHIAYSNHFVCCMVGCSKLLCACVDGAACWRPLVLSVLRPLPLTTLQPA